jgi:hypothetical protein
MNNRFLAAIAVSFLLTGGVQAADLLFYGPSIGDGDKGIPINEVEVAQDDGHNTTVVDDGQWAAMTAGQFASYDAIIFGDGSCSDDTDFSVPNANKTTWSPIVTGPIVLHTFDPFAHQDGNPGAIILTSNGMNVASSGPGTGLYYANGCRDGDFPSPPSKGESDFFILPFLSEFGTFILQDAVPGFGTINADDVTVVDPSHPVVNGLNDSNLSDWGNSTHALIDTFPSEFSVIATAEDCVRPDEGRKTDNGRPEQGKGSGASCDPDAGDGKGNGNGIVVSGPALIVRDPVPIGPIPTLSPVGLGLLGLILAGLGGALVARRRRS